MKRIIIFSFLFIISIVKTRGQTCTAFVTPSVAAVTCTAGAAGYIATFTAVATTTTSPSVRHDWYHPYHPGYSFNTSTSFQNAYSGPLVPGIYTVVTTYSSIPCSVTNTFQVFGSGFPSFNPTSTTNYSLGCSPLNQSTLCIMNAITTTSSVPRFYFASPSTSLSVPYSSVSFGMQSCATITTSGTWKLVVRDSSNGCQALVPVIVSQNTLAPHVSASFPTQTLTCTTPTILATGNSTTSGTYITWMVPVGPPVNSPTVVVGPGTGPATSSSSSTYATYSIVATNTLNGCTNATTIPFYQNFTGATSASFTHTVGLNGLVNFSNATSGNSMTCNWNFGDGFVATGNPMSHTYGSAGAYNVQLAVTDSGTSCLKTTTLSVNVTSAPCFANSNFTVVPTATAQYWNVIPAYPWNISNAVWNWGDGSTSNGLYSSHTYSAAGTYTLCLTVSVSCGANSTTCNSYFISKGGNNNVMVNVNVIPPSPVTVGIRDSESDHLLFSVYPNPNNGQFNVHVKGLKDGDAFIGIFNVMGTLVYSVNGSVTNAELNKEINAEEIAPGIYFMKVSTGEKTYTKKMIISK